MQDSAFEALLTEEVPELRCGVYRHWKGGFYLLLGVGQLTETTGKCVVYVSLTGAHQPGPRMRIRPLWLFIEPVTVDGVSVPRFEYVGHEIPGSTPSPPKIPGVKADTANAD